MPNRNQIIVISVLCLIAFLIGYFEDSINISIGKRAEVQEPVPSTIVTNVTTNLANNIVTNIITNTAPVQPKPNPVRPQPTPTRVLTLKEMDVIGTYQLNSSISTSKYVFLENGIIEGYHNGKKLDRGFKWSIVDGEIHIVDGEIHAISDSGVTGVLRINTDKSITSIADILAGKRKEFTKERQQTYKKIK